jgi:hypothetical protein
VKRAEAEALAAAEQAANKRLSENNYNSQWEDPAATLQQIQEIQPKANAACASALDTVHGTASGATVGGR